MSNKNGLLWFVLIVIVVFFLVIILISLFSQPDPEPSVEAKKEVGFEPESAMWSTPVLTSNVRANCSMYEFTAEMIGKQAIYFGPSLDTAILDSLDPQTVPDCLLPTQIVASQHMRTCQADQCIGFDGQVYTMGETEIIYLGCDQNVNECPGTTSLIALGFNPCRDIDYCLVNPDVNAPSTAAVATECDAGDKRQLHQITRVDSSGQPSPVGNLAKIVNVGTGNCLIDNPNFISGYIYQPCDASTNSSDGTISLPNEGLGWTLLPSIKMTSDGEEIITAQTMTFTSFNQDLQAQSPTTVQGIENFYNQNNFDIPSLPPGLPGSLSNVVVGQPTTSNVDIQNRDVLDNINLQFLDYRAYNALRTKLTYPSSSLFGGCVPDTSVPFFVPAGNSTT